MTRINLFRTASIRTTPATVKSVAWGKINSVKINSAKNIFNTTSPLIFAAILIVCSLAVGCSSEKPQSTSSTTPSPIAQPTPMNASSMPAPSAPVQQAAVKPAHKKIVRKAPATVTYADKTSGVTFEYPRKYGLKTGDAATELVSADPVPMNFTRLGGVALAAVALPESTYPNSDLASAFFNVSMNKTLTADQCGEFSVPQPKPAPTADPAVQATTQPATTQDSKSSAAKLPTSKLLIGDLELQSTEMTLDGQTSNGLREESSKYYHVFQNGACYEFALKVATAQPAAAPGAEPTADSATKHVDRDEVFHRLEQILATVKINTVKIDPVVAPQVNAEVKTPVQPTTAETPAQ
jgi:hypothetical protein